MEFDEDIDDPTAQLFNDVAKTPIYKFEQEEKYEESDNVRTAADALLKNELRLTENTSGYIKLRKAIKEKINVKFQTGSEGKPKEC
jgi:hypothetical protein